MPRPLSQELADLSARAKQAEETVAATKDKGSSMLRQREDEIKAEAERRKLALHQGAQESRDSVAHSWTNISDKVQSDFNDMRAKVDAKIYEHDRNMASRVADDAEENAERAIYFALDAIDYAETAVLDATMTREFASSL